MSGWRDEILIDAVARPARDGADRPRAYNYITTASSRDHEQRFLTRREREKREVSGLPKHVRERRWKGV